MKKGWVVKPMGELCSIKNGKSNSEDAVDDAPYAFFDRSKKIKRSTKYLFDCEALIIPGEGAEFLPRQYSGKFDLHQRAYALYDFKNEIDLKYLYYFLIHEKDYFPRVAVGATVKSLRLRHFEDLPVLHPPLPEQQRIVGKLDAAFAALTEAQAHVERNRANARELFESYLNGVFEGKGDGDEWVRLDEVCEITSMLVDPRLPEHIDLVHVGGGNIESKTGKLIDLKTAREEELKSGKFLFDESMVLYNKIRPYLVKVVRPTFSGLCSADMYPLSPKAGRLDRDYLYYALLSNHFTEYAISGSDRAGMPKVNREHLFAYEFPLPSLKEQQCIAKSLDAILPETQALETTYQQKLSELAGLKKAVLGAAFRGEL
jgi:type I restriction enzyme S subunit